MFKVEIPGSNPLLLHNLVLDMNGTLTCDGRLMKGVAERLSLIKEKLEVFLLTADTFGTASQVSEELNINLKIVDRNHGASDKLALVEELGAEHTVAIGNGNNDHLMLKRAALSIAVIGPEGCSALALSSSKIICLSILDALDLLIYPSRLIATLRP